MPKPAGFTDDEWDAELEARAARAAIEQQWSRIEREGFEVVGFDPADDERCVNRMWRKPRGRWLHEPCGKPVETVLDFRAPSNPEGVRVPLCRSCIVLLVKDLVGYLD